LAKKEGFFPSNTPGGQIDYTLQLIETRLALCSDYKVFGDVESRRCTAVDSRSAP